MASQVRKTSGDLRSRHLHRYDEQLCLLERKATHYAKTAAALAESSPRRQSSWNSSVKQLLADANALINKAARLDPANSSAQWREVRIRATAVRDQANDMQRTLKALAVAPSIPRQRRRGAVVESPQAAKKPKRRRETNSVWAVSAGLPSLGRGR